MIHPQLVVYAAHCGAGNKTIRFGEDAFAGGREVAVETCRVYPGYAGDQDQGHDVAYCKLQAPITEFAVTPPLFGCETQLLEVGTEVALAGFGQVLDGDGSSGIKHWGATSLVAVTPTKNTTLVGNPNLANTPSICSGDSGGPAFLRLADGGWRTFGIASTVVGPCGGYGTHASLHGAIGWIEQDSGIDVTPCHAADGSWAPGPACAAANSQAPGVGSGSWDDWCSGTPSGPAATTCGPAWDQFDAKLPPSVQILAPSSGDTFLEGAVIDVQVAAVKHPDGFAVARVHLEIDEVASVTDDNDPWLFGGVGLAAGSHTLVAIAEDWAGNRVESSPITIGFGDVEWPPETTDTDAGSEDDTPGTDGGSACDCATSTREDVPFALLLWVCVGLAVRRRLDKNTR
ncbi:Permease of the drug/metabolite transporter (DMT) superfamily protein [Enhygromyxa salina]|uniref:Permease of the drug/metabolite transporter (DMT) superfamily protein n=1 Tax=Enhygromyxa salina TaxID=215803 RepID=A0A0C1Z670_9BACT|nr:Permease of the drug/metabolite transporter (DMT) superfamily protein [Enhygromyxa salina]